MLIIMIQLCVHEIDYDVETPLFVVCKINDIVMFLLKTIGLCIITFNLYALVAQVDFLKFFSAKIQFVD